MVIPEEKKKKKKKKKSYNINSEAATYVIYARAVELRGATELRH